MNGFINILKPTGLSSSDVVVRVKKIINFKKVGHLGTLDPGGAGVLPVAVGKSTRLFDYFLGKDKVYRATITFAKCTDTVDSYGKITGQCNRIPDESDVKSVLKEFIGTITQVPPMYSAISINGRRAYDLARKGEIVDMPKRQVEIYSLDFVRKVDDKTYMFDCCCSAGTYIRSLVSEIADKLNSVAYMSSIIRLRSGCFEIADSITLDELRFQVENGGFNLMSPQDVLSSLESFNVDLKFKSQISNGVPIKVNCSDTNCIKVFCDSEFYGLGEISNSLLKIVTYLKD